MNVNDLSWHFDDIILNIFLRHFLAILRLCCLYGEIHTPSEL